MNNPPEPPESPGCDHAAALERIETQLLILTEALAQHQRHVGDTYATLIGDGLAVQMKLASLHTAIQNLTPGPR